MYGFKAALVFCATLMVLMMLHIFFNHTYSIVVNTQERGVYVFDHSAEQLVHCDASTIQCKTLPYNSMEHEIVNKKSKQTNTNKQNTTQETE